VPDILRTSLSGLVAFQKALSVTANNISNANTDGYSRQRVELATRPPSAFGDGFVGNGVQVATVRRLVDQFATAQMRSSSNQLGQASMYADAARRIDDVMGDSRNGIAANLQAFFNAWQTVANDPASVANRSLLLQQAQSLASSFQQTSLRLDAIADDASSRIKASVNEINGLAESLARLNERIGVAQASSGGQPANDLLDQRDKLIVQLSRQVSVQTNVESDGQVSVFIGNGQALVLQNTAVPLATVPNALDPTRLDLASVRNGTPQIITSGLSGGEIGGLLQARERLLDPARNALGLVATALTLGVNAQQASGMDLRGQLGAPMFSVPAPAVLTSGDNTGTAALAASVADLGQLTNEDYVLRYTGTAWVAQAGSTGAPVAVAGTGTAADPLRIGGVALVVTGAPAAEDRFLVQPTRAAAGALRMAIDDPRVLAAAAPIRSVSSTGNVGTGTISPGQVLDPTDPNLTATVTIQFLTPTTYSVNGSGSFAYTPGANLDLNGWRVQISGAPAVGDTFRVERNAGGQADNRNALLMAGLQTRGLLDGGQTGISESFRAAVGELGEASRQAALAREAQEAIAGDARAEVLAVSGVNLDEEASEMLRWQQAYGAAAKVVGVADDMFRTLLASLRN
jgi:flagellar hook-associated protein 1 FlgK